MRLHVPVPPIVVDTVSVRSKTDYGFEYTDEMSSASISQVTITGPETLRITLNTVPAGLHPRLSYAFTGLPGSWAGAFVEGSARGNIRDSDSTPSPYGNNLANWLVHFDYELPFDAAHIGAFELAPRIVLTSIAPGLNKVEYIFQAGRTNLFSVSSNLVDWLSLGLRIADTNGVSSIESVDSESSPRRFYKAEPR